MEVQLAVVELMRRYGIDNYTQEELAERLKVRRQQVWRIVNGHSESVSYEQVGSLCSWLLEKVPDDATRRSLRRELPGALFRQAGLWGRLTATDYVSLRMGERYVRRPGSQGIVDRWISGADSKLAMDLVRELTEAGGTFALDWATVPLHLNIVGDGTASPPSSDVDDARKMLSELERRSNSGIVVIGSQRVNLLTELIVASVYGCEPFSPSSGGIPFYLQYRSDDHYLPTSCFGGLEAPRGCDARGPGVYYRLLDGEWQHSCWIAEKRDAGIVLVTESEEDNRIVAVVFGFSGSGTGMVGRHFCRHHEDFWPTKRTRKGRVGAFLCRVALDDPDAAAEVSLLAPHPIHGV